MRLPKITKHRTKNMMTIHGMNYQCESCGEQRIMWLQTGLEEPKNPNSKPVPFITACPKCGGYFKHVRWNEDIFLPGPRPIAHHMNRFENRKGADCGVPVFTKVSDE